MRHHLKTAPDPRINRPKTLSAAKALVNQICREQGWSAAESRRYFNQHGGDFETAAGVREILAAMESSRMIIFSEE